MPLLAVIKLGAQHVSCLHALQSEAADHELDALEDVCTQASLLAPQNSSCNYECAQMQTLLVQHVSVEQFQHELQSLLLASMRLLQLAESR